MAVSDAVKAIANELVLIPGIKRAFDAPPEQLGDLPALVIYPNIGEWRVRTHDVGNGNLGLWSIHTVNADLWVTRANLPVDTEQATAFIEPIAHALFRGWRRDKFGGTVAFFGNPDNKSQSPIRYELGEGIWGGAEHIRLAVNVDVAIQSEVTE